MSEELNMTPKWHFTPLMPGFTVRNPVSASFFDNDTHLDSIVREAIQNSIDAHASDTRVEVRIYFSGNSDVALTGSQYERYRVADEDHYDVKGNGLAKPVPTAADDCPFLAIEDFETTGLTGSIEKIPLKTETDRAAWNYNDYFFCDGSTNKGKKTNADTIGSHGAGKCTFMRASRLKTVFTLTVRDGYSPRKFVAGKMTLKSYQDDNGQTWQPDAFFGVSVPVASADAARAFPQRPLDSENYEDWVRQFEADFNLMRGDRPGTSIVIPYARFDKNAEGGDKSEEVKADLVRAVLRNFLVALLDNRLKVTISTGLGEDDIVITRESLDDLAAYLPDEAQGVQKVTITRRHFDLAREVLAPDFDPSRAYTLKLPKNGKPELDMAQLLEGLDLKKLKKQLLSEKPLLFNVPMRVHMKKSEEYPDGGTDGGSFKVAIVHAPIAKSMKTAFYRIGLLIPEVSIQQLPSYVTMAFVGEGPIAKMLVDSEPPAHNTWNDDAERITDNFIKSTSHISYVAQMATKIVQAVAAADKKPDSSVLIDVFGVDLEPDNEERERTKKPETTDPGLRPPDWPQDKPWPPETPPDPPGTHPQKLLNISQLDTEDETGFAISMPADVVAEHGYPIKVAFRFGYLTDAGLDWDPFDFDFGAKNCPIKIRLAPESEQGVVSWSDPKENRLELCIQRPGAFTLKVVGFSRDLEYGCQRGGYVYPEEA